MKPAVVTESSKLKCTFFLMSMFHVKSVMENVITGKHLEVKYKGKNISDILDMTVEEGVSFFENIPKIKPETANDL